MIDIAAVPTNTAAFVQFVQRVGAGGIDDGQAWNAGDQSMFLQFHERFAKRAAVAQVSAGNNDPIGNFPTQCFQDAEHDRLLAFQPERIDAVDQVDTQLL